MFGSYLQRTKDGHPLVHCITNTVTVNDVANMLLASGGRPIMADDIAEVEDIQRICSAMYINIGTLNSRTIPAMLKAVTVTNEVGHPLVLDPVGVGASALRTETATKLLAQGHMTVIRGNVSEIRAIADGVSRTAGVDAAEGDEGDLSSIDNVVALTQRLSQKLDTVIATTGIIDVISYGKTSYLVKNGHPLMRDVTGTGCQVTALIGAFVGASPDSPLEATVAAIATMGIAGEIAYKLLQPGEGNSTYRNRLIDSVFHLTGEELDKLIQVEERHG